MAESGELLGFLGALNIGQERPLFAKSRFGIIAEDVANTRVTFQGRGFTLDDGTAGKRFGTSFAIKTYPAKTSCTMFDELNLPVDMVVTHSFTPINSNIMASRIKRQQRLMKASDDGAISLAEELVDALDDLESKRLSFGVSSVSAYGTK
jgi:type IV secretion system protein VirB4